MLVFILGYRGSLFLFIFFSLDYGFITKTIKKQTLTDEVMLRQGFKQRSFCPCRVWDSSRWHVACTKALSHQSGSSSFSVVFERHCYFLIQGGHPLFGPF